MSIQMVNGYPCNDCTDVSSAKKHIDPKHPKDGPYGVNAKADPSSGPDRDKAVTFGGASASLTANPATATATNGANGAFDAGSASNSPRQPLSQQTGGLVDLVA